MKKRFLSHSRSLILPAALLAIRGTACAAEPVTGPLINVDFNGTGGVGRSTDPVTFDGDLLQNAPTGASVAWEDGNAQVNDVWNGFDVPNQKDQPLVDSTGAATLLSLTWEGFTSTYTNYLNGSGEDRTEGPNGDGHVLGSSASSGTVMVNGLNPAVSYNVVVISPGSDPVKFSIGAEAQTVSRWSAAGNPSTWVQFTGIIPDGSGRITITVSSVSTNNFGIGGLQITPVGAVSDTDGDGMPDAWEDANGLNSSNPADGSLTVSPLTDPDGDGVPNRTEFQNNTNPNDPDTDADGYSDKVETKTGIWVSESNTGTDPLKPDTDGDGLSDFEENLNLPTGSNPNKRDTDSDGFADGVEVASGTNPKDPTSFPGTIDPPRTIVPAILVNYDFNGDESGTGPLPDPILFDGNLAGNAFTSASVAFEDGFLTTNDLWNGALGKEPQEVFQDIPQPTLDSKGYPSAVTVKWSGFAYNYTNYNNTGGTGGFTSGPNADGFYAKTNATPTITIGGLSEGVTYDIATLGAGDSAKFTIEGEAKTIQSWSPQNTANWQVFEGLSADGNGEIVVTVASINGEANFGIGGIQIAYLGTPVNFPKQITAIVRDATTGGITLTWTSVAGKSYTVLWSTDPAAVPVPVTGQTNVPGAAGTTTRSFAPPLADASRLFFRVREE